MAHAEIVGAVDDHVRPGDQVDGVGCAERLLDRLDADMRVDRRQATSSRLDLGLADVGRVEQNLALQIG
jgi:hypothetical protein